MGATQLVDTLRTADQSAACWTCATQKDVAFITRHQVQEAAVRHWDAAHAAGLPTGPDEVFGEQSVDAGLLERFRDLCFTD